MRGREANAGAGGPEDGSGLRSGSRRLASEGALPPADTLQGRRGVLGAWLGWMRAQPVLAAALLLFCAGALGGLVASLPRGTLTIGRTSRAPGDAPVSASAARAPATRPEAPVSQTPDSAADAAAGAEPGSWIEKAPSTPSARGLTLVYRYRALPLGGESRYEWIVQVRGARSALESIDVVTWRMEPAAKNGAEFTSRDRATDGFPLFGHGPGGWFGVSATIDYQDGEEETLTRRIDLPD